MAQTVTPQTNPTPSRSMLPRSLFSRPLFEDFFERFLSEANGHGFGELLNTAMDVVENDQAFEVKMDLPGVNTDDVEIHIENNTLTIRGKREEQQESVDKSTQYHRVERATGSFSRSVVLPAAINDDETVAEFKDGVLTVTIPKTEDAKPRRIAIKR